MVFLYSKWISILIFSADLYLCGGVKLVSPETITVKIGPNSFKLECDISDVSGGKKWSLLWWYKLSHDHKSWILLMEYSTSSTYGYASRDVYDIRGRTDLFYDAKRQVFGIIYKEVRCIDAGVYQCRGKRYTHKAFSMDQTQTVIIVQVPRPTFLKPLITVMPDDDKFKMGSKITFFCSGNVGGPAGYFWWFLVKDGQETNITDEAEVETITESSYACTNDAAATMTLVVTYQLEDAAVRCKAYVPTEDPPQSGCEGACFESFRVYIAGDEVAQRMLTDSSVMVAVFVIGLITLLAATGWVFFQMKRKIGEEELARAEKEQLQGEEQEQLPGAEQDQLRSAELGQDDVHIDTTVVDNESRELLDPKD